MAPKTNYVKLWPTKIPQILQAISLKQIKDIILGNLKTFDIKNFGKFLIVFEILNIGSILFKNLEM